MHLAILPLPFLFFFLVYHKPQHLYSAHFTWKDNSSCYTFTEWTEIECMNEPEKNTSPIFLNVLFQFSAHTQHCYPFMTFLLCLQLFYWLLPMPVVFSQTISLVIQTLHSRHVDPAFSYSIGLSFHSKDDLPSTNHSLLLSFTKFILDTHLQCLKFFKLSKMVG